VITEQVLRVEKFFNCKISLTTIEFLKEHASIPKKSRGVYIIYNDNKVYYVGKGNIKDRQPHHVEKFTGIFKNAQDTAGFKLLRENFTTRELDSLKISYAQIDQETLISAIEGALIHLLQPIANDEVIKNSVRS
jgi:hypothetical protein